MLEYKLKTRCYAENVMLIVHINCLHELCQHNITFGRLTAVTYAIFKTEIFCHRYAKMNNSATR